jgi:hypothetical protein
LGLFLVPQLPSLLAQTEPEEYLKETELTVLALYLGGLLHLVGVVQGAEAQAVWPVHLVVARQRLV